MEHRIQNCTMTPHPLAGDPENTFYLNIEADGHFWRTSPILSAVLTVRENGKYISHLFEADPAVESDEFELLSSLVPILPRKGIFYTFNGTSFVLPFLEKKLKAYVLENPLTGLEHRDLYRILKPLYYYLRLPSRRMSDYLEVINTGSLKPELPAENSPQESQEYALPALTHLLPYLVFPGNDLIPDTFRPEITDVTRDDEHVYFICRLPYKVPKKASFTAGPYYLIADGEKLSCSVQVENETIRRYFPDYENYRYLPMEGYAIHRSVASFVPKERQIQAERDTCFIKVKLTDQFLTDRATQKAYLESVRTYIRGTIG